MSSISKTNYGLRARWLAIKDILFAEEFFIVATGKDWISNHNVYRQDGNAVIAGYKKTHEALSEILNKKQNPAPET